MCGTPSTPRTPAQGRACDFICARHPRRLEADASLDDATTSNIRSPLPVRVEETAPSVHVELSIVDPHHRRPCRTTQRTSHRGAAPIFGWDVGMRRPPHASGLL